MKKTFKLSVRIDGAKAPVFMDNEKAGVIATVEVTYDLTMDMYKSPLFANSLLQRQRDFMEEIVKVEIEEVE